MFNQQKDFEDLDETDCNKLIAAMKEIKSQLYSIYNNEDLDTKSLLRTIDNIQSIVNKVEKELTCKL